MPRQRDDNVLRALGDRIRSFREQRGLTQAQLAEASKIEPVTLSRYECGARSPSVSTLAALAEALDVDLAVLVGIGRDVPPSNRRAAEVVGVRLLHGLDDARLDLAVKLLRDLANWSG